MAEIGTIVFRPRDAGRGDPVGQRAVVRLADHADRAGRSRTRVTGVAVGGVRGVAAVQPVDHRDDRVDLVLAADVAAAGRAVGADDVDADHRVPARDEVVVVVQRHLLDDAVLVVGLLLALVAATAAGVVRRGVHDDRDLAAGQRGLAGPDDVDRDHVVLAVGVGVHRGVDVHRLADRVRVVVDRLGAVRALVDVATAARRPAGSASSLLARRLGRDSGESRPTRRGERWSTSGAARARTGDGTQAERGGRDQDASSWCGRSSWLGRLVTRGPQSQVLETLPGTCHVPRTVRSATTFR